ncbi:alpha/beta fold hydrolase [Glaciimonas sp. CA11.2]|uniref:bifunctional 4-carboxymuconolactone decarboxylase/3-oxoadipate enol-lactonase PcaCD n=1 Tax=unclassified Glaciimonas TaxID=2644401 RepID=UPI002AB47D78|nr:MULTISPECIES: alpha/beta fold hydrolase [unclassified Glaciimonas]MDY7548446.1 alpha/beta fold hydrolase [Glaciimonas sp. CA11.2]MEB0010405.1 alpha/beta fold hydrolase [Glaciimonas sp. Cout2]MEB0084396.1 alpha/beta fold hydrolase [Glaciimonas sp. Gout2]MEB0164785.1 alpha/beta fold hydrolase [Glaciimonas sp. CA11.2]
MSYDPIDHDFERGMENRRRILGDEWVNRSVANATEFNAEFQHLITRFAWNDIWGRPGLEKKTRRVIVLAITMALSRWEEFELHARAALLGDPETRLTPDEMKEVLMQAAIYAGVPAANTAFTHAQHILREIGAQIGYPLLPLLPANTCHPGIGQEGLTTSKPALHYSVRAPRSGKAPRHTVVLSHALGCDLTMWDGLANLLAADCRVITYDQRGHGSSDAPTGLTTITELADDAARLLRELDSGPVVWIGLSMGGMVGQELAINHPSLIAALVIANSTSCYPDAAREMWQQRIETVRSKGLEAIAEAVMGRYFNDRFRTEHSATVTRFRQRLISTDVDGYIACCHAVGNVDTTAQLAQIAVQTLVIAGAQDQGTPLAMSQTLCEKISNAQLIVLEDASHLSAIEQPEAFAKAALQFIADL